MSWRAPRGATATTPRSASPPPQSEQQQAAPSTAESEMGSTSVLLDRDHGAPFEEAAGRASPPESPRRLPRPDERRGAGLHAGGHARPDVGRRGRNSEEDGPCLIQTVDALTGSVSG